MSAEEADKTATTDASAGDEEEEWLYGDESESKDEDEEAKLNAAVSAPADASTEDAAAHATGNGVASEATGEAAGEDVDSDSDSDDDDDDVRVTIGDIKTGAPQYTPYGAPPVNLNIKTTGSRPYGQTTKLKGVDLDAPGNINGVPVLEVEMESFEEKPWRKPGADLSDYFNYGFNEDTWKAYCEKQKRLRMGLEVSTVGSVTSKITVQQGRTGNEKDMSSLPVHTSKPDFTSPVSLYKSAVTQVTRISPPQWTGPPVQDMSYYTSYQIRDDPGLQRMSPLSHADLYPPLELSLDPMKTSGTIDVIGGQTATISRVEGRRRHNLDGNNIQVIAEQSDAEPTPAKIPPFFPPGPIPPNIPPPPFLPPPPNVSTAPPLIPPPRLPITVPPPGFPPPPSGPPPSIIPTMDRQSRRWSHHPETTEPVTVKASSGSHRGLEGAEQHHRSAARGRCGHPGGYDGRSVPPYPFPQGAYPPPMAGGVPPPWPPMMENSKPWDYYPRRDDKRDKERDRPRERTHEREREREHSPSAMSYTSDEERYRYREYQERGYAERHRDRSSREKEERHRERRHREKEEGRHKSSRSSSSRRRHDSEEGDSHRRHKHKKSKRSKEGKEASEEISADQENQEAME
ncbi:pre-mRNA 3'-end-processing factor FIP1 isoform X4 [Larimichthys crocea]|uniref:pre-mRNA 3'-end-processing factor FIP1 isoform X4 n=1 Tax=Larimichthys crocea TaxID=215358 RepID=UPI000F5DA778|nr:pre-mRNA 3'-end-processing factor FIP1 isoform X4 [Larimichthys crocea]